MASKKWKFSIIIYMCIVFFELSGCSIPYKIEKKEQHTVKQDRTESNETKKNRITKEDLINKYHITERELEGVDVVSFLSMYNFEPGVTKEEYLRHKLQFFKEEFNDEGYMDYSYMIKESANTNFTSDKLNDIVRIAWNENEGDRIEALVFDFELQRIYEGADMEFFDKNNLIGNIDDSTKQKVIQTLSDYKIYDWKDYYKGGSLKGTTGSYGWQMAIEFSDGTLWQTGGDGLGKKAYPTNMEEFITALRKCEPQNTTTPE